MGRAADSNGAAFSPPAVAWHALPEAGVLKRHEARAEGLSDDQAAERRREFGLNVLRSKAPPTALVIFLHQFLSPLLYVLLGAGVIAALRHVEDSVIFENVTIGRGCRIHRANVEANLEIPGGSEVGQSPSADRARGRCIAESGIIVLHCGSLGLQKRITGTPSSAAKPARAEANRFHELAKALSAGS